LPYVFQWAIHAFLFAIFTFSYLSICNCGFTKFCIVLRVRNSTFISSSLKSFVIFFVSLLLYVKEAHLVLWCCGLVFLSCLCSFRCLVARFILYLLLCSVGLWCLVPFLLLLLLLGTYVCTLIIRYLMFIRVAGIILYYEICFCMFSMHIANFNFIFLRCTSIVISRKSVELCCFFFRWWTLHWFVVCWVCLIFHLCFLLFVNYENIVYVSKILNYFIFHYNWIYVSANIAVVGTPMANP
jgi:hypothetical protein